MPVLHIYRIHRAVNQFCGLGMLDFGLLCAIRAVFTNVHRVGVTVPFNVKAKHITDRAHRQISRVTAGNRVNSHSIHIMHNLLDIVVYNLARGQQQHIFRLCTPCLLCGNGAQ